MSQDSFTAYVLELLAPLGGVTARSMFGGHGIYRDGLIFGLVAVGTLYFKAGEADRATFEALGSEPFTYDAKGKRTAMSYWRVPEAVLEDSDHLLTLARGACAAARSVPRKPPKGTRPVTARAARSRH